MRKGCEKQARMDTAEKRKDNLFGPDASFRLATLVFRVVTFPPYSQFLCISHALARARLKIMHGRIPVWGGNCIVRPAYANE